MKAQTVLLIGRATDPHIIGIKKELDLMGEEYFLMDSLTVNDSIVIKNIKGGFCGWLQVNGKQIDLETIKSIWNSNALQITNESDLLEESKEFVEKEWTEGIMSMWNTIRGTWVNHPLAIGSIGNRVKQLQIASKINLKTPRTLVTNDPEEMNRFFDDCNGEMIAKTLGSSQGLPHKKMIFTEKLSKKDLVHSDNLKYAPVMFQEYIPKKTEFRVTIIGDKIHSAEIHSQNSLKTKHDWRHYDDFSKTPYVKSELTEEISTKLLKTMKEFNLNFGACDLIRTPNDEFIFLEINPNGRWWWIQELTNMKISEDIAKFLAYN